MNSVFSTLSWGTVSALLCTAATFSAVGAETLRSTETEAVRQTEHSNPALLEQKLGVLAFDFGDYSNAVKFLEKSRQSAPKGSEERGQNTALLAAALLKQGDVDSARNLLVELEKEYPSVDPGFLPGELRMAEGNYVQAEEFFTRILQKIDLPEQLHLRALFLRGSCRFAHNDIDGALADYQAVEMLPDSEEIHAAARFRRIYILLESGKIKEAETLLADRKYAPYYPLDQARLRLLLTLKRGNLEEFKKNYPAVLHAGKIHPDSWMFQLSCTAALEWKKRGDETTALEFLGGAFPFASNDRQRQHLLLEIANLQSGKQPRQAAATLLKYLELYPDSPLRTELLLRAARLKHQGGDNKEALQLYATVSGDRKIPAANRVTAARESAVIAEESNDLKSAGELLHYALRQTDSEIKKAEIQMELGKFQFRQKAYREAAKWFQQVAKGGRTEFENASFWLMQSLMALKEYHQAEPLALALRNAKNQELRSRAQYAEAQILEKLQKYTEARRQYREFAKQNPRSADRMNAEYNAAMLDFRLKDYADAIRHLTVFSARYAKTPQAPQALYYAIIASHFGTQGKERELLTKLDETYPKSRFLIEARLQLAENLRAAKNYDAAAKMLAEIDEKNAVQNGYGAELSYQRAGIALASGKTQESLQLLDSILKTSPDSLSAPDAALMAGNIAADAGKYEAAIRYYARAEELRPVPPYPDLCKGRIADCYFGLYSGNLEKRDLDKAAEIYEVLAKKTTRPHLALMSSYKLGRCRELADKVTEAREAYAKTLYLAVELKKRGLRFDPLWPERAAYSLLQIHLKRAQAADYQAALKTLDIFESLNIPQSDDILRIRQEIEQRQKL